MYDSDFSRFDEIPDAVIVTDRKGLIVHATRQAEALFGYEEGGLDGRSVECLMLESARTRHGERLKAYFAEPSVRLMGSNLQVFGVRADGQEFPVEIAVGPSDDGMHGIAVIRDISLAEEAKRKLSESEFRFRVAAESTVDMVWEGDVEADSMTWFGDIDSAMGYEPGGFPRTIEGFKDHIHPDDIDEMNRLIEQTISTGDYFRAEYRIRARDGSYRHWSARGAPIDSNDGRRNNYVGSITDVTDQVMARKGLEDALNEIARLKQQVEAENEYLQEELRREHRFEEIVGESAPMLAMLEKVEQVAQTGSTVLLLGETGTGKELVARAIHAISARKDRPLIKVDCTTLPSELAESELFGHEKGAFTGAYKASKGRFALAHEGTVFLDEIGELSLDLQAKLLRVLQDGEFERLGSSRTQRVNVRVIAATNRDLEAEVSRGSFRADLYYRLGVFPIEIPPLRDRREDIPLLTAFLVSKIGRSAGKEISSIPPEVIERLSGYDWPGNVRELHNVLERAVILSPGSSLILDENLPGSRTELEVSGDSLRQDLEAVERHRIRRVLDECGWKIKGADNAASRLGLKPSSLRSRMKKLGIERPSAPKAIGTAGRGGNRSGRA